MFNFHLTLLVVVFYTPLALIEKVVGVNFWSMQNRVNEGFNIKHVIILLEKYA